MKRLGCALLLVGLWVATAAASADVILRSPNGRIEVTVGVGQAGELLDVPFYSVKLDGETLIEDSRLGIAFQEGGPLSYMLLRDARTSSGRSTYALPFGKTSFVNDAYEEGSFTLDEIPAPYRRIVLSFRVFNDGFGFKYSFPKQPGLSDFVITDELTDIKLAENPTLYGLPLSFGSSYEWYYRVGTIDKFASWDNLALPLLLEYPSGKYVGVTEADLTDYAGLYFAHSKADADTLEARLAPWPGQTAIKVKGSTPFESPWRVFMIGDSPKPLLESNILEDLNPPQAIADTSWIRAGKVQFPWWNGYVVPHPDPKHKPGLNTWTLEHYIDFCAANGIEFHSIDGFDQAWYGGPVDPFQSSGVTQAIPEINMPEVLAYAKFHGVGTRLWVNWGGLSKEIDHALSTYEQWGVSGIMVDFLNRDDQLMVRSYHEILRKAAEHHLTITFHGVFKPTGQGRTYPNLMTHEAVLGTEYNKWSDTGSTPEHEVQVAYVRALAGPLDVHEGGFRPVSVQNYKSSWIAPNVMGTLARQLAFYVVYENHTPMLADYPEIYEENPVPFKFIQEVPVVWDETRMLAGQVGKFITMGRRKGGDWYLGTITDREARSFSIPLDFLGAGNFVAEIYSDSPDYATHPEKVVFERKPVTSADHLDVILAPAGGQAVRIHRILR